MLKRGILRIRLTPAEKLAFEQAAALRGQSLSVWLRDHLRDVARRDLSAARMEVPFLPQPQQPQHEAA